MTRWRSIVIIGLGVSLGGTSLAASEAFPSQEERIRLASAAQQFIEKAKVRLAASPEEEAADASEPQEGELTPSAQEFIDAAKERLEAKRRAEEERLAAEEQARQEHLEAKRQAEEERRAAKERVRQERLAAEERARQERLEAQRQAHMERELEQQRRQAQELAIQAAHEQMQQRAEQQREAVRQLETARERQLKALYQKGQALYQQGSYPEAIETLQKMAVVDPDHPLIKSADRLLAQAELKRFEQRLRASLELPPQARGAVVPELESLLTHKRIEIETLFKYAKIAIRGERYDTALKLLTGVLVQDPSHREAQQLIEQVQMAKLDQERDEVTRRVERDETAMINEVLKAQVVPESQQTQMQRGLLAPPAPSAIAPQLQEPISFEFNEVALSDVLEFVSDAANISIVPSPALDLKDQLVTLRVKDMPLEQAIKYLVKSLSLAYRVDEDAVLIATAEEFSSEPMETRVFFLHNGLSPFALETAALEPNAAMGMETIQELILRTVPQPPDSRLVVDQRSGALIVTNTTQHLAMTEQLLSQLDVTPIQVLIESRFVELTLTDLDQSAIEGVLTGSVALTKKDQGDLSRDAGHAIASGGGSTFASLAREGEGLNLTLEGILTGTQFESVLHLLEESQRSKTLSAPRVTVLNNQTATIRVVDEFRYPTRYEVSLIQFDTNGDGDFDDAGETEFANVPQDFQKRDIGILLNVTPSVGKDLRTITLVLSPEVSDFSQFRDLGGDVTVPEFTSSQLTTSVVVEGGQTVVLGGLMKDTTEEDLSKVPFLGDLPIVGGLFRQRQEKNTRKNLLIFITARVLGPSGQTT